MTLMPGWNSVDTVGGIAHWLHISAIAVLALLVVAEGLALIYDSRKDTLVSAAQRVVDEQRQEEQRETDKQHAAKIAAANETAKAANDELARIKERQAPRHLTDAEKTAIFDAIAPFQGQKVKITSVPGDWESNQFADEFYQLVDKAGWNCINSPGDFEMIYAGGSPIGIEVTLNLADVKARHAPPITAAAYNSLMDALHKLGLVKPDEPAFANEGVESGMIEIRIGTKPRNRGETSHDIHPEKAIPFPQN